RVAGGAAAARLRSAAIPGTPPPLRAQKRRSPGRECLMDAVHRYEGTVNQVIGDGIMALCGAPIAHEDRAVRACYAALAMQAALRRYTDEVPRTRGEGITNDLYLDDLLGN